MSTKSALVIIDYQNIHLTAHDIWAPKGEPKHTTLIHPLKFATQLVSKRERTLAGIAMSGKGHKQKTGLEVGGVHVFRGCPSNSNDSTAYSRSQAQKAEWTRDHRVTVTYRTLKYSGHPPEPREKGIDVMVAIDVVESVRRGDYDVVILAAHDTDQEPALEAAMDIAAESGVDVETGGWEGCKILKPSGRKTWHTALSAAEFLSARDRRLYS